MTAEAAFMAVARQSTVLDVLASRIESFRTKHGVLPTVVRVNPALTTALSVELIKQAAMPPEYAVAWPVVIAGVVVVPDFVIGDDYLHLAHLRFKLLEVL